MKGVYFAQYEHRLFPGDSGFALGLFTTFDAATGHVAHLQAQSGFADAPNRFSIEFWAFDRTVWESGFAFGERQHGPDIPFWAKRLRPTNGERARAYAKRLCNHRFGRGRYHMGPSSEYAQLKKRRLSSRPGVESNPALTVCANGGGKLVAAVWELSHEHEFRDGDGFISDHTKFLGFFSSREKARDAERALMSKPGFRDTRDGFSCERLRLDMPQWCEGFTTCTHGPAGALDLPAWFRGCVTCAL